MSTDKNRVCECGCEQYEIRPSYIGRNKEVLFVVECEQCHEYLIPVVAFRGLDNQEVIDRCREAWNAYMPMNNKEQHELAAKAAGIRLEWDVFPDDWRPMYREGETYRPFCPRVDDGDAFRLAAAANIVWGWYSSNAVWARGELINTSKVFRESHERDGVQDKRDALRMAIFRAAVEIGKSMP